MFYIGIDIAKFAHFVAIVDADGTPCCEPFAIKNNAHGYAELLIRIGAVGGTFENCEIGMESTGNYWVALLEFLSKHGFSVILINPLQTDAFRRVDTIRLTKTDPVDATMIANLIRLRKFDQRIVANENSESLKYLSRYRTSVTQDSTAIKNKITSLLDCVFPEYCQIFSSPYGPGSRAVLKTCATPRQMLRLGSAKLASILAEGSKGKLGDARADELIEAARTSVGVEFAEEAISFEIKILVERLEFLEKQRRRLDVEILTYLESTPGHWLTTVPGIGNILAAQIYSEIGDIRRFSSSKKLVAYAGLDAARKQSGETDIEGHISKRGSPYLRLAITQAADGARKHSAYFNEYYSRKISEGRHHYHALACTARKLTCVIYTLLKEQRPYEEEPPNRPS